MKIILAFNALALLLSACVSAPSDLYGVHSALPEHAPAPAASSAGDTRHFAALLPYGRTQ